jgi:starch-binding outer membrane protein, SusD/RagB family
MKTNIFVTIADFVISRFFILTILILSLVSCQSILEEDPVSLAVADSHYTTKSGIDDGVNAAYSFLRNFYGSQGAFYLTVTGTDIYTNGFGGVKNNPSFNNYDQNLLGHHGFLSQLWNNFYQGINQCNTIVERTPDVTDMNENDKAVAIGEARFLRALFYFHLVQQFGNVHFTLNETIGVETEANRTSVNTIYQEGIIPDLQYAVSNLPNVQEKYGKATKPAAEALLARVYLVLENWSEAEKLAKNVIENYNFSLVVPYSELWKIENDVNEEIVWAVQYTSDPLTNGPGNGSHMYFITQYYQNPAMVRDIENGRPFQRFMPTNYFLNLWDVESDLRWDYSFKTVWIANTTGTINGHTVVPGDTAIKMVLHPVDDEIQNTVPYWYIDYNNENVSTQKDRFQIGGRDRLMFPCLWKYYDNLRPDVNAADGRRDFPVIRLAEMYLIAAEAAHLQDKNDVAAQLINQLRERAIKPGKEAQMLVETGDISLDFILEERARELCGEMHRWYDLKRTGLLLERVRLHNYDAAPNIKEMHLVRPIPQTQVDRVSNPGDFPQNPGY